MRDDKDTATKLRALITMSLSDHIFYNNKIHIYQKLRILQKHKLKEIAVE